MLTTSQIRRLVILAAFCGVSIFLLFRQGRIRDGGPPQGAAGDPARAVPEKPEKAVPPPPPSRLPEGAVVLDGALRDTKDRTALRGIETEHGYLKLLDHVASVEPSGNGRAAQTGISSASSSARKRCSSRILSRDQRPGR